jgi:thiol-disulfide isomerase/thioredoxin
MRSTLVRLFAFAICFFCILGCTRRSESGLNPGDFAPDFKLESLASGEQALSSFRGKLVLLNFWASWCGPCVSEMPALQRLHDRYKDRGFTVVAVSVDDDLDAVKEFRQKFGLGFPILVDNDGVTKSSYKSTGVPESFFVDASGKLILFSDPEDRAPSVRIVGPREWDSPNMVSRIEKLLAKADGKSS